MTKQADFKPRAGTHGQDRRGVRGGAGAATQHIPTRRAGFVQDRARAVS